MSDPLAIELNGKPHTLPADATVADLLEELDLPEDGVAVAVDSQIVPRGQQDRFLLKDGARVEVIRAVGGG